MFSLIEYNKKEKGGKFGIRKKVPLRLYRIPFRGGEENKIKFSPFFLFLINGKGKREIERESRLKQLFHYENAWKFEERSL